MSQNDRSPWWYGGCSLKVGGRYAVCPGRGKHALGHITVVSVERVRLGWLSDEEAVREGFPNAMSFAEAFGTINGGYHRDAVVWRVELADPARMAERLFAEGVA